MNSPAIEQRLMAICAELEVAAEMCDGDRSVRALEAMAAEFGPELARFFTEGLIDTAIGRLAERIGADDPVAFDQST